MTDRQKARDLARIALPGKYLSIFDAIYNHGYDLPKTLAQAVTKKGGGFGPIGEEVDGGTQFAIFGIEKSICPRPITLGWRLCRDENLSADGRAFGREWRSRDLFDFEPSHCGVNARLKYTGRTKTD